METIIAVKRTSLIKDKTQCPSEVIGAFKSEEIARVYLKHYFIEESENLRILFENGILRISATDNKDLDFLYEVEAFNLIDESFINELDS